MTMEPMQQVAALAYVETPGAPLVLLVTTRGRGRWTIPKGWPKQKADDAAMAAREAFEEGGVGGEVSTAPFGTYEYSKRFHFFSWARCRATVYPLRVDRQFLAWPEKASRAITWVTADKAAKLVRDRHLADLLRDFAKRGV
jgi:8-oxo-dGTP pyrophosphatase MutT (NUDIX family)